MIRNLFTRRAPPAAPEPKAHDGFFLTMGSPSLSRLEIGKRISNAMGRSFQRELTISHAVDSEGSSVAMDGDIQAAKVMATTQGFLPIHQLEWYASQGFIGWQMAAVLSQNWLISKACSMPGQDAVRHGWEYSINDGTKVDPKVIDAMRKADEKFKVVANCEEHIRNARIFGVRHTLFEVEGINYEAPFNPDGVKQGAYKGMTQIDPYWMAPEFNREDAADPKSRHFYEPTWWRINGKRYHRSHFVISRNMSDPPDLLKPSYFYGGIPTTQKIYERVYASERTANEAPLLAMTKRLFTLQTDITKAMADPVKFKEKLEEWLSMLNNFGCKVTGLDETVGQIDTNLTGLDETIMTQYQLVAAAAEIPVTKLLGTVPKGFNATGEYDEKSYSQFLETLQANELSPLIRRHALLAIRSEVAPAAKVKPFDVGVSWRPTTAYTTKEKAEINKIKAETHQIYVNAGAIDGTVVQEVITADPDSGYNGIDMPEPRDPTDETTDTGPDEGDEAGAEA